MIYIPARVSVIFLSLVFIDENKTDDKQELGILRPWCATYRYNEVARRFLIPTAQSSSLIFNEWTSKHIFLKFMPLTFYGEVLCRMKG